MALPISAGEILDVAKWAFDLWKSCKAAKGKFEQVSKEVYGMRTVIEIARLHCKSSSSIINHVDDEKKTLRRQLGVYIQNCKKALSEAEALLQRYKRMSIPERIRWVFGGSAEVADLVSDLSSFTTQLNTFNNSLTLSGVGVVNANVLGGFTAILKGIDRIEEALEKNDGDEKVAVKEVMQDIGRTGVSHEEAITYHDIIQGYAREVCPMENLLSTRRAQTPDLSRGRDPDSNLLDVAPAAPRRRSVNSSPGEGQVKYQKGPFLGRPGGKKSEYTLECWLVQVKSTKALFVSFQVSEKEKQTRGQWKLREMAKQFEASSQASQLANDHELVNWVLQDRKKEEKNKDFTWYPHAAKIESKNMLYLGLGVEEQAMIIIKRQMTPEAQRKFNKKALAIEKGAQAEKAKPGKEQPQTEKGQQKEQTPKGKPPEGKPPEQPQEGKGQRKGQTPKGKPEEGKGQRKGQPPEGKPVDGKPPEQPQEGKGKRKGQPPEQPQEGKGQRKGQTPKGKPEEGKGQRKGQTPKGKPEDGKGQPQKGKPAEGKPLEQPQEGKEQRKGQTPKGKPVDGKPPEQPEERKGQPEEGKEQPEEGKGQPQKGKEQRKGQPQEGKPAEGKPLGEKPTKMTPPEGRKPAEGTGRRPPEGKPGERKPREGRTQPERTGRTPSEGKPAGMKQPEGKWQPQQGKGQLQEGKGQRLDEKPQAGKGHPPEGKPEEEKPSKGKGQRQGERGQQQERKGQRQDKKPQVEPGQRQEETPEDEAKKKAKPSTSR